MAGNSRTLEQVRLEIEAEREQLADAVDHLRSEIDEATNVGAKLRKKLPVVAAAAIGAGFLFAGGVGATTRRHDEGPLRAVLLCRPRLTPVLEQDAPRAAPSA